MAAWIPVIATVLGALLTAVLGNRLIQFWQQRNWRNQQQFSGLEKEYVALKSLSDSILKDCGARLASMRDLNSAVLRGSYEAELIAYREVINSWNKSIHANYAQLTFQLKWEFAKELEWHVHEGFVEAGRLMEFDIRAQRAGAQPNRKSFNKADKRLNEVAGAIASFGRTLVRETELRRQEVFYGKRLTYRKSDILLLSNFDLIKLLFHSDVDHFSVVRPTADVFSPLGRRL